LPPGYERALEAGLAQLGLEVPVAARTAIDGHVRLLLAWTGAINLTAVRDPVEVARRHVLDSLAGVRILERLDGERFLDLGSGGGFPGLPLVAALPGRTALLVESVTKKAAFLSTAVAAVGLASRVAVANARAEVIASQPGDRGRWPVVVVRAVAPLADIVELAFPLLASGGHVVAWKRGELAAELAGARRALTALGGGTMTVEPAGVADLPAHVLVVVRKSGPTPDGYPRDPALRKRQPW
jgi:16S rRNA (guanine527-N7)-methyltransferase